MEIVVLLAFPWILLYPLEEKYLGNKQWYNNSLLTGLDGLPLCVWSGMILNIFIFFLLCNS